MRLIAKRATKISAIQGGGEQTGFGKARWSCEEETRLIECYESIRDVEVDKANDAPCEVPCRKVTKTIMTDEACRH